MIHDPISGSLLVVVTFSQASFCLCFSESKHLKSLNGLWIWLILVRCSLSSCFCFLWIWNHERDLDSRVFDVLKEPHKCNFCISIIIMESMLSCNLRHTIHGQHLYLACVKFWLNLVRFLSLLGFLGIRNQQWLLKYGIFHVHIEPFQSRFCTLSSTIVKSMLGRELWYAILFQIIKQFFIELWLNLVRFFNS